MDIVEILSEKVSKMIWCLTDQSLPERQAPMHLNFIIHCEVFYDKNTSDSLFSFAKEFNLLTGRRMAVCISTPRCPYVKRSMEKGRYAEGEFANRLLALSKIADIGYHGHFYINAPDGGLVQISHLNYDKDTVTRQMREEVGWLRSAGLSPKIYTAGWWFLKEEIVLELERLGFVVDGSIRRGKRDTFGSRYLEDSEIPAAGMPFILPPSRNILEIQSAFGPVMVVPLMKWHLARLMKENMDTDSFLLFHLHDWNVLESYRNVLKNLNELSNFNKAIRWENLPDMRELYSSKNG